MNTNQTTNTINVLIINPGEPHRRALIPNTLEAKQHIVGGYIENVYIGEHASCYVNEEGKLTGLLPNRALTDDTGDVLDILCGTILITGHDPETGRDTDLTAQEARSCTLRLGGPLLTAI